VIEATNATPVDPSIFETCADYSNALTLDISTFDHESMAHRKNKGRNYIIAQGINEEVIALFSFPDLSYFYHTDTTPCLPKGEYKISMLDGDLGDVDGYDISNNWITEGVSLTIPQCQGVSLTKIFKSQIFFVDIIRSQVSAVD
jgi:hypothetical protein